MQLKKILGFIFLCILMLSCNKDDNTDADPSPYQELSFAIRPIKTDNDLKEWECKPYDANYLQLVLNDKQFFMPVFRIDGFLYSQTIRHVLDMGEDSTLLRITTFVLWNSGILTETNLPGIDDTIVMGTPDLESDYSQYVINPLEYRVMVPNTKHFSIAMEVLCYETDQSGHYYSK